ncbi:MAG: transcriptional regulator [Candidatus Diapherotrites archaeon]
MVMRLPCELVGWYLLPAIRMELVKEMVKGGMPRKDVAKQLGLTEAAVCNYIKGKRGANIALDGKAKAKIRAIAKKIADKEKGGKETFIGETCALCISLRKAGALCKMHKEQGAPKDCNAC